MFYYTSSDLQKGLRMQLELCVSLRYVWDKNASVEAIFWYEKSILNMRNQNKQMVTHLPQEPNL